MNQRITTEALNRGHEVVVVRDPANVQSPDARSALVPGDATKSDRVAQLARGAEAAKLDRSYLSPAAEIHPGTRTGKYRTGGDELLTDSSGHSEITFEDYAAALVDEIEQPRHVGRRFSVAI